MTNPKNDIRNTLGQCQKSFNFLKNNWVGRETYVKDRRPFPYAEPFR